MSDAAKHVPMSYNVINKGNPEALFRAIDSVYGALYREGDECILVDTGSTDEELAEISELLKDFPNLKLTDRRDLARDYTKILNENLDPKFVVEFADHVGDSKGLLDFAEARNVALSLSNNEIIIWIDSDDVLVEEQAGALRMAIDNIYGVEEPNIDAMMLEYHYAHDEDGTCITRQRRERVFPKSRMYWKGKCHETAIPREGTQPKAMGLFEGLNSYIKHTDDRKPHRISDIRNYAILSAAVKEEEEAQCIDPRTVFYLANSLRGLEQFHGALSLYKQFDKLSGSEDDRFAAMYYIAGMYMSPQMQRPVQAYDAYFECIKIKPSDPRGYFGLQHATMQLCRHEESLQWYGIGRQFKMPQEQIMSYDPTSVDYRPHVYASFANKELEREEEAIECAQRAVSNRPQAESSTQLREHFTGWAAGMRMSKGLIASLSGMDSCLQRPAIEDAMKYMRTSTPSLEKIGIGKTETADPRTEKPEVVIWCGQTGEDWGPLSRLTGMGGSEKMVILLSERLQATGAVNVSVYAAVPVEQRGIDSNDVKWAHWSEFDEKKSRDVLVVWRQVEAIAKLQSPARLRVLWNHDVQNPARYTPEVLATTDFVQFQSEFHTHPVKDVIPESKMWVARNAIEVPEVRAELERESKRILYCSSPDRGLLTAARIVAKAQETDPEIEFVVTYGVTPWARKMFAQNGHRHIPDVGHDISQDVYERQVGEALDKANAEVLHRVGFEEMEILMQSSAVWLYPTRFDEISCMSAMEAQANGCLPVSTVHGALAETVKNGIQLPALTSSGEATEEYIEECAEVLLLALNDVSVDREDMAKQAIEAFNVDDLAKQWLDKFGIALPDSAARESQSDVKEDDGLICSRSDKPSSTTS